MSTLSSWPRKRSVTSVQDAKWTSAGAAGGKIISTLVLEKVEKFWGLPHFLEIVVLDRIRAGPKAYQRFSQLQSIAGYHLSTFPRHSRLVCAHSRTLFLRVSVICFGAPIQTPKFVFLRRPLANPSVIPPLHPPHKVRIQSLKAGAWCYI
jgi:hypothetical protein